MHQKTRNTRPGTRPFSPLPLASRAYLSAGETYWEPTGLSTRPLNLWPRRRQRTRPRRASLRPVQRRGSQWPSSHIASVQGSRAGPELPWSSAACGSTDAASGRERDQTSVAALPTGYGSPTPGPLHDHAPLTAQRSAHLISKGLQGATREASSTGAFGPRSTRCPPAAHRGKQNPQDLREDLFSRRHAPAQGAAPSSGTHVARRRSRDRAPSLRRNDGGEISEILAVAPARGAWLVPRSPTTPAQASATLGSLPIRTRAPSSATCPPLPQRPVPRRARVRRSRQDEGGGRA